MTTRKRMSRQNRIVLVCVAVLVVAVAVLAVINYGDKTMPGGDAALLVLSNGKNLKEYTMDEIKALPMASAEKTIVSGNMGKNAGKGDESGVFAGVAFEDLMSDADPAWADKYTEFVLTAEDGFTSAVYLSEVKKGGNVIVAYEKDGKPILSKEDGGLGPLRVVVMDDAFGNRSAWYLKTIEARA